MNFSDIKKIKDKILNGYQITKEEAINLSQTGNIETLYYSANQIRANFCGSLFEMCCIINDVFDKCSEDCAWCPMSSLSKVNYTMYEQFDFDREIKMINEIHKQGVKLLEYCTNQKNLNNLQLNHAIEQLNKFSEATKIKICASCGSLSYDQLKRLKEETKVNIYHCNLETSPDFYKKVCTTNNQESKVETLKNAKKLGFEIWSGGIIGMGETMTDRIDFALKLRELEPKTITLNILFPFAGTPLEKQPRMNSQDILTTFAIFRFINPRAKIRLGRGRSLIKIIEKEALRAGINSSVVGELFVNAQPEEIENDKQRFEEEGFIISK
ncbi:MAG: biotin synthase BioB [Bacteroidales bacterium]|nr:biotin synthase BioB [Bacteroidales bacterium]